jgi:hypothetical protein
MSESNGNGIATQAPVVKGPELEVVEKLVPKGESYRIIEITSEAYDAVMEVCDAASERGLPDGLEYWFGVLAARHAKVQMGLWEKNDGAKLISQAKKGNSKALAQLQAVLAKHGLK